MIGIPVGTYILSFVESSYWEHKLPEKSRNLYNKTFEDFCTEQKRDKRVIFFKYCIILFSS